MPPGSSQLTISPLPDGRILGFTLGVSLLTAVVFGLVPALQTTKADVSPTLKDQVGSVAGGASVGLRKALAVVQVTLSLVLLVAASLFIRSLRNLKDLDPDFARTTC